MLVEMIYKPLVEDIQQNILALDISVKGTGWAYFNKDKMDFEVGIIKLQTKDNKYRRREFKKHIKQLMGKRDIDKLIIEDTIMGNNYKTTEILMQLNVIPEDLIMDGEVIVTDKNVLRYKPTVWNKKLRDYTKYNGVIKGKNTKIITQECLHSIGVTQEYLQARTVTHITDDVYDAYGMIITYITDKR